MKGKMMCSTRVQKNEGVGISAATTISLAQKFDKISQEIHKAG
jgi:hypothetical protein